MIIFLLTLAAAEENQDSKTQGNLGGNNITTTIILVLMLVTIIYSLVWLVYIRNNRPSITFHHKVFLLASGATFLYLLSLLILNVFKIQNDINVYIIIATVVLCSLSDSVIYIILSILRYPIETGFLIFLIVSIVSLLPSYFEFRRLLNNLQGSIFPFIFNFMIIIFLCIIIVIIGYKGDPHEGAEGSRRSKLFLTFLIITALYIISTSICIKMPELSWVESVIQPTYNILLLLLSGWFYIGFNPQGYQPLNEQKDNNDGYGLGDDLVFESGSGDIPPILVKKQKKKLDDKSDIFDDVDDFSDSSSHGVKLD